MIWLYWTEAVVTSLAVFCLAGLGGQVLGEVRDRKRFPPPGDWVDVGGFRLHFLLQGEGEPTVIFDSALAGSALSWSLVQPAIAGFARTLSYDRAGLGWSDPGPAPRTAQQAARELAALLDALALPGPFVLVGHSFGGLTARAFTALYPEKVAGLVLVDAVSLPEWLAMTEERRQRLAAGIRLSRRGALLARWGVARLVAIMATSPFWKLARAGVTAVSGGKLKNKQEGMLGPVSRLPEQFRPALKLMWTQPRFYQAMAGQLEHLPESVAAVHAAGGYGDRPLVVLSAANPSPTWQQEQRQVAQLSSRGRYRFVPDCGHWIPLDQPQAVIDAVREVLDELRGVGMSASSR